MSNLLVVRGNTALKAAWSDGTVLGRTYRYQGEKTLEYLLSLTEKEKPEIMTIATVDAVSDEDIKRLQLECKNLIILDKNHTSFLIKYDFPEYLTYDRAAGLIASRFLFSGKSCTVFDFGTTLTVDFIDSNGRYLGGNISPGCRTRFKALNRYSRVLPLVDTPDNIDLEGKSVVSSMESGVVLGIMFEAEGYIRQKQDNIIIFTGGDAIYFAKKLKNSIFVVCNLELMGLAIITDEYVKNNL